MQIEIVHLQRVRTSVRLHAKKQTLNQFNTRNPWFGEVFTFDIYDANPVGYVIRVSVYDKNAASRDHVRVCTCFVFSCVQVYIEVTMYVQAVTMCVQVYI